MSGTRDKSLKEQPTKTDPEAQMSLALSVKSYCFNAIQLSTHLLLFRVFIQENFTLEVTC